MIREAALVRKDSDPISSVLSRAGDSERSGGLETEVEPTLWVGTLAAQPDTYLISANL